MYYVNVDSLRGYCCSKCNNSHPVPTAASAAPQLVTSSTDLQATAQEIAHNFVIDQLSADGNSVSLKKGSFRLSSDGNAIDFVGENGRTFMQAPLQGFFGESIVALRAAIGNGGSTLTLSPGHVIRQATHSPSYSVRLLFPEISVLGLISTTTTPTMLQSTIPVTSSEESSWVLSPALSAGGSFSEL